MIVAGTVVGTSVPHTGKINVKFRMRRKIANII
jgi:hypothetical protein